MPHYLLIGAGFSRNWGGWLATEVFEYLLGTHEVQTDQYIRELLWRNRETGGFEAALDELQSSNDETSRKQLAALNRAIARMFSDMNSSFEAIEFNPSNDSKYSIIGFLSRFDAVFSLNQDLLLEMKYFASDNIKHTGHGKWDAAQFPGMLPQPMSHHDKLWVPANESQFQVENNLQPIFKLHGSSNWRTSDDSSLMVIGGSKAREIKRTAILKWYSECFSARIQEPDARLMAIGYGFRDAHINRQIEIASERGLKLFVIAPEGAALASTNNNSRAPGRLGGTQTLLEEVFERCLIGASRRPLLDIFGKDQVEHKKVLSFFNQ